MHPNGQTVIITGASTGIGAATARVFSASGAQVVLAARDATRLQSVAQALPGPALAVPMDITDSAAIRRLVEQTIKTFGGIDMLISNAGVGLASPVAAISKADLHYVLGVNLLGPMELTQTVLPHMRERRHGHLIYVSSVVGLRALPYLGGYAATKAALDRLCEALRIELRGSGVAVTLVRPSTTQTQFATHRLGQGREHRRFQARAASPEEVARVILRAAIRQSRVAYVSWVDRLMALFGLVAPRLTDRMLAGLFHWEGQASVPPSGDRAID